MIKNLNQFNEMYFNSLKDFLNVEEIANTVDFAICDSEEDLNAISETLSDILNDIPDDFYKNFKVSPQNIAPNSQQLSFNMFDIITRIKAFLNTSKASFFNTLLVLSCFDFSFINYIIPENPNYNPNGLPFKKYTNETCSVYYSNVSFFKALLLRPLESLSSDINLEKYLYKHSDIAIACGFDPLVIPSRSAFCRFKDKISPVKLLAIFYFILTVIIADNLINLSVCSTDSTHVFSRANENNRIPISDGVELYNTHSDLNANRGHKTKDFNFFGYKVHTAADSISRFVLGFILTPGSSNDSPLFVPLQKLIKKMTYLKFNAYAADKGYDSNSNNNFVVNELDSNPVIPMRNLTKQSNLEHFIIKNNIPYCIYTNMPLKTNGQDKQANCQMWICPNVSKNFDCNCLEKCKPKSQNNIRTFKTYFDDVRKMGTSNLPKHSPKWKDIYNKRVHIEQIFSELKQSFTLNSLTEFKLSNIFFHIGFSMIAYNLSLFVWK